MTSVDVPPMFELRRHKKSRLIKIICIIFLSLCSCICNFTYAEFQRLKTANTSCSVEVFSHSLYNLLNTTVLWIAIGYHHLEGKFRFSETITQIDNINYVLKTRFSVNVSTKKYDRVQIISTSSLVAFILTTTAHLVYSKEVHYATDSLRIHLLYLFSALMKFAAHICTAIILVTDIIIVRLTTNQMVILRNLNGHSLIYRKIHSQNFEIGNDLNINSGLLLLAISIYSFGHSVYFIWSEIKPEYSCLSRVSPYSIISIPVIMVLAILYFTTQATRIVSKHLTEAMH